MNLLLTCPRGLGQLLKQEVSRLGYTVTQAQSSYVRVSTDDLKAIAHLNVWSRLANTVYLEVASGSCGDLDEYFGLVGSVDRSRYIGLGQGVVVTAPHTDRFRSARTLQSLGMKSIMTSLTGGGEWYTDDSQPSLSVVMMEQGGVVSVLIDASGEPLYKRGYRLDTGHAPLKENLAVGLLLGLGWRRKESLLDPCCGSGTICIEAAMLAINMAPGLQRGFAFEQFGWYDQRLLVEVQREARDAQYAIDPTRYSIHGTDRDAMMIQIAQENAARAGVSELISFDQKEVADYAIISGVICTNPPYGERLQDADVEAVHSSLIRLLEGVECRGGMITGYDGISRMLSHHSPKHWKSKTMMNGALECVWLKVV